MYPAAFIVYNMSNINLSFDEYLIQIGLKEREKIKIKATKEELAKIHEMARKILEKAGKNEKNI